VAGNVERNLAMNIAVRKNPVARAFTLIELIAVIVVLAILSGIAIPKYFDYAQEAKKSSVKGTLGAVRSAIANYYANSAVNGSPAYPLLSALEDYTTTNRVMQEPIAGNPFKGGTAADAADVMAATWSATPPVSGNAGWAYDVATGRFWANSTTAGVNEHLY
jgi:prepilin-type N-terminal cleavage/methylation domain-containing protein